MTDIAETTYEEDEGGCHAVTEDGTRCPNPAEAGSRYCGLPDHQALADVDSDHVVAPAAEVADADRDQAFGGPVDLVDQDTATGMAAEPGPLGGLDEGAEEQAAAEDAAAIGGPPREPEDLTLEEQPSQAEVPVREGGGEDAAGQEQVDEEVRRAAEEPPDADLTPDGQGFDEPDRRP